MTFIHNNVVITFHLMVPFSSEQFVIWYFCKSGSQSHLHSISEWIGFSPIGHMQGRKEIFDVLIFLNWCMDHQHRVLLEQSCLVRIHCTLLLCTDCQLFVQPTNITLSDNRTANRGIYWNSNLVNSHSTDFKRMSFSCISIMLYSLCKLLHKITWTGLEEIEENFTVFLT